MSTANAEATAALPEVQAPRGTAVLAFGRADALNIALLLGAFVLVLLVVPPVRSYPVIDDWIYAQSVQRLLALDYRPHEMAMASSLGHLAWAVAPVMLFGLSYNVLTATNLVISAVCLVLSYVLLRRTGIAPGYALFGTALLGCNPLYLHLSYTFMTDITFIAYVLAACICITEGVRTGRNAWLWGGSALIALAYLTRQLGVLVAAAALFYLWWAGRLNVKTAAATALLPALALVAFMLWERTQPAPMVHYLVEEEIRKSLANPGTALLGRAQRLVWVATLLGWALLPILAFPRRLLAALVLYAGFVALQVRSVLIAGSMLPESGNVIDRTGFGMYDYNARPVWDLQVWSLVALSGTLFVALLLTNYGERLLGWLRSRPWRNVRTADPALMLYATVIILGLVTVISPFMFDRYILPVLPFLVFPALRRLQAGGNPGVPVWRWVLVLPLLLFGLVAQVDYKSRAAARWEAAESLVAQGIPAEHVVAGFEWMGWNYYERAAEYVRQHDSANTSSLIWPANAIQDPEYVVGERALPDYDLEREVPYTAWLDGGQERAVLVQKRR